MIYELLICICFTAFSKKDTEDEKDTQENFEAQLLEDLEQMGQVSDQKWFATKSKEQVQKVASSQ